MVAELYIDGVTEVQNSLGSILLGTPEMTKRALRAGGAVVGDAMQRRAPRLSGVMENTLGRSVHMLFIGSESNAVWVGTRHGLAATFEYGGEITPRRRRYLRFIGADDAEVFARSVIIPAQPWLRPAVDESRRAAARAVERAARASLERRAA